MYCVICCICHSAGVYQSITAHAPAANALLHDWQLLLTAWLGGMPEVWYIACMMCCLV